MGLRSLSHQNYPNTLVFNVWIGAAMSHFQQANPSKTFFWNLKPSWLIVLVIGYSAKGNLTHSELAYIPTGLWGALLCSSGWDYCCHRGRCFGCKPFLLIGGHKLHIAAPLSPQHLLHRYHSLYRYAFPTSPCHGDLVLGRKLWKYIWFFY